MRFNSYPTKTGHAYVGWRTSRPGANTWIVHVDMYGVSFESALGEQETHEHRLICERFGVKIPTGVQW